MVWTQGYNAVISFGVIDRPGEGTVVFRKTVVGVTNNSLSKDYLHVSLVTWRFQSNMEIICLLLIRGLSSAFFKYFPRVISRLIHLIFVTKQEIQMFEIAQLRLLEYENLHYWQPCPT